MSRYTSLLKHTYLYRLRQITLRDIYRSYGFDRSPKPTSTPISFTTKKIILHEMPKNVFGVGFGNFSCIKVGCAIPHWKNVCTHTILEKQLSIFQLLLSKCPGYPKMNKYWHFQDCCIKFTP